MSTASTRTAAPTANSLHWRSWPLRDELRQWLFVVACLAISGATVAWATGKPHLALLAVAVLALTFWRFFVPVAFHVDETGIWRTVLGWRRHTPWAAVRRYEVARDGLLLMPDDDRTPLAYFRGQFVPWGRHREELLELVGRFLRKP